MNKEYKGELIDNQTNSHKIWLDAALYIHILVTPLNYSQADIKIELWDSKHLVLKQSVDKRNYTKPEEMNATIFEPGDYFIDVYTTNNINTSYILLVSDYHTDLTPFFILLISIIIIIIIAFFIYYFYGRIYDYISFLRWRKNFDPADIKNYPIASQSKYGIPTQYPNGFTVNVKKKNLIKSATTLLYTISAIITILYLIKDIILNFWK